MKEAPKACACLDSCFNSRARCAAGKQYSIVPADPIFPQESDMASYALTIDRKIAVVVKEGGHGDVKTLEVVSKLLVVHVF